MATATSHQALDRRVCVWFGEHKIVEHVSESAFASKYEAAMRRRFAGLRVTNEPVTTVMPDVDLS